MVRNLEQGLLHVITRSIGEMMYETSFTKYTLRKKKYNFLTFLRGELSLFYSYSNFWVLQENHEQFWNRFFAHCYQDHWQNEIHYKEHLSTLFPKRNAAFNAAFLLKKSVRNDLVVGPEEIEEKTILKALLEEKINFYIPKLNNTNIDLREPQGF